MYYSSIGILAVLILFIVNQDILRNLRITYERPAWNAYRRFLISVLVYYLTDVLWGILESLKLRDLLFADTTVYYAAMAMGMAFWTQYTVAYLNEDHAFGRFLEYTASITGGLISLLTVVNIFFPVLFTVDRDCVYHALPMRYVILAVQVLLLLLIAIYAFVTMGRLSDREEKGRRYGTLGFFGVIMSVFLFVQLWFPFLPLYTIAYMLGTSMLHSFVAIDEREDYERELKEAERITELKETISSLLDNIPGLTFTKDAQSGVYLACNQAFAEYAHKSSPAEVTGLTDEQIFDAETAAHFVSDDRLALSMSRPYIFFEDVPDAAGERRQLQTTKLKYKDAAGRLCLLGMCQDVTDMVRIQHEHAMTQEAYENAVSSSLMFTNIALTLARDYTDMYYVNTDSEEFIEYRRGGDSGALSESRRGWHFFSDCKMELSEQVWPKDREAFLQAMNRRSLMEALSRNNTFQMTYRQSAAAGPVYMNMKVSRMEDDEQYIIVGFSDVNAQMRDAMAKSEAMAEALTLAVKANKAKTSFLSSMSHEIRSPMTAIISLDRLALKNRELDPGTRDYLEKIGSSASHLLALMNNILDISRMESGQVVLRREVFSFSVMLEQINTAFAARCEEKGLDYQCRILRPADECYMGDDMKLKEVLVNLLSNAVHFTQAPGSVTLTVEPLEEVEDQALLCFRVRDTGIGIDKEDLPGLFEAFSREEGSRRKKNGSSGLGMAITKRIVEMMNGTISVESEKGAGTEFTVTVTLHTCDQSSTAPEWAFEPSHLSVLVVDDDPIEAEHARMVLEEAGIRADACTSGGDALRMLEVRRTRQKPYNIVLLDWNMPDMSGMETAVEIRRRFGDEVIVVALTAYSWDDIHEEAQQAGVNSALTKPLLPEHVMERLGQIARRNHMNLFREKARSSLTGRRVLLAEDMEINAEIMMDTLSLEGIRADHAENGRIAVEMFRASPPGTYAAVLMDVRMPEMDGLEAATAIRALDRPDAQRIPIIALTANAFDEDVQHSLQAGMNAHLTKPVESEQLIQTLGELVCQAEQES